MKKLKAVFYILSFVLFLANLIFSHGNEYSTQNTEASLISAVKNYIGNDAEFPIEPEYVLSTTVGKQLVVIFQDSNYENFMGAVIFKKGINGLYRPINMEYGMDSTVRYISTRRLLTDPKSQTVFYSTQLPEEVNSIEILKHSMFNSQGEFTSKYVTAAKVSNNPFIYVYPKGSFRDFRLLDANSNVVPYNQYSEEIPHNSCYVTSFILDLSLILILFAISLLLFVIHLFSVKKSNKTEHS